MERKKKELLSLLEILELNSIEMSTVYYNFRQNDEIIEVSQITSDSAQKFLSINRKDEVSESKITLENVNIYIMDTKK